MKTNEVATWEHRRHPGKKFTYRRSGYKVFLTTIGDDPYQVTIEDFRAIYRLGWTSDKHRAPSFPAKKPKKGNEMATKPGYWIHPEKHPDMKFTGHAFIGRVEFVAFGEKPFVVREKSFNIAKINGWVFISQFKMKNGMGE